MADVGLLESRAYQEPESGDRQLAGLIEKFLTDAARGLSVGENREQNFAVGTAGFLSIGSLLYAFGAPRGWAQFFMGAGLILFGLWLGTVRSATRPPLIFQLLAGAMAMAALVYFLFGGGF